MFSETAKYYDLIYDQFRDYSRDVDLILAFVRRFAPNAGTVLDVGCGTGRHAQGLIQEGGYRVDGVDIEPAFVEIARERCPTGQFTVADMSDFHLDRKYDLLLCLFSSIGYVKTRERLQATSQCLADHLTPKGIALVEPWFTPDAFLPGRVHHIVAEAKDLTIVRMNSSVVRDGISFLNFHYLLGGEDGVEHLQETHELGLFTPEEMREGFEGGGLVVAEYDPEGLVGRGMYVLRRA